MVEPQYQELKSKEIPKPSKDGVTVAVISGEALGVKVRQAAAVFGKTELLSDTSRLLALIVFIAVHVPQFMGWTCFRGVRISET